MTAAHRRRPRLMTRLLASMTLILGLTATAVGTQESAQAADLSGFEPGLIISDSIFFDSTTMNAYGIQVFLNQKGATCVPGADGTPCLKNFHQVTTYRAPDAQCPGGYPQVGNESAASIIAKVASACGINPQVILTTLQKEQGLVKATGTSLYASRYRSAMGFGCPDTAVCDAKYYGFFNQVYQASWQFKNYALNPTSYNFSAYATFNVQYHPNAACGVSTFKIQNQATAGLYNYTPYTPNVASLAAGYGVGDSCSSYGNRNFWNYFTDWFGSTTQRRLTAHIQGEDLYGILGTTSWPPSGIVEMHAQSKSSGYANRLLDKATRWAAGKPDEWRFFIGSASGDTRPDLIGVHTTGTVSGKVEVKVASWVSYYQDTVLQIATPMASFAPDSTVQMAVGGPSGGDLYFVMVDKTGSGKTEVHALSAASNYTVWSMHAASALPTGYLTTQVRFLVARGTGDLYLVLHDKTGSGRSEMHALTAASHYSTFSLHTALPIGYTADTGVQWLLGTSSKPDLFLMQLLGTGTGKVEAHRMSAVSNYTNWSLHVTTSLPQIAYPIWQFSAG